MANRKIINFGFFIVPRGTFVIKALEKILGPFFVEVISEDLETSPNAAMLTAAKKDINKFSIYGLQIREISTIDKTRD